MPPRASSSRKRKKEPAVKVKKEPPPLVEAPPLEEPNSGLGFTQPHPLHTPDAIPPFATSRASASQQRRRGDGRPLSTTPSRNPGPMGTPSETVTRSENAQSSPLRSTTTDEDSQHSSEEQDQEVMERLRLFFGVPVKIASATDKKAKRSRQEGGGSWFWLAWNVLIWYAMWRVNVSAYFQFHGTPTTKLEWCAILYAVGVGVRWVFEYTSSRYLFLQAVDKGHDGLLLKRLRSYAPTYTWTMKNWHTETGVETYKDLENKLQTRSKSHTCYTHSAQTSFVFDECTDKSYLEVESPQDFGGNQEGPTRFVVVVKDDITFAHSGVATQYTTLKENWYRNNSTDLHQDFSATVSLGGGYETGGATYLFCTDKENADSYRPVVEVCCLIVCAWCLTDFFFPRPHIPTLRFHLNKQLDIYGAEHLLDPRVRVPTISELAKNPIHSFRSRD